MGMFEPRRRTGYYVHVNRRTLKTNVTSRRLLFILVFALVALPASWMVVSAAAPDRFAGSPQPGDSGGTGATVQPARHGTLGARTTSGEGPTQSKSKPASAPSAAPVGTDAPAPGRAPVSGQGVHADIVTTIFWAGEGADASNAYISNAPSAWDEIWSEHFGGVDDPGRRNGFSPAGFTPRENPFYFALPYSDYDAQGRRKASANRCSQYSGVSSPDTSWCKNAWIKITKGGKAAYAQWQDVGPMETDDTAYVFGSARPANTNLSKAGLDVSPAVRDYLGLRDVDSTSWQFVTPGAVPAGPWKQIVTSSGLYWR